MRWDCHVVRQAFFCVLLKSRQGDEREELDCLTLSFFDVIIRLEFNLFVISDKLEWSPEPHLQKFLRFHEMISSIDE